MITIPYNYLFKKVTLLLLITMQLLKPVRNIKHVEDNANVFYY